jgi:Protein of unknown function (DUF4238)
MSKTQNQHYVPKFVLRQFLLNPSGEQVAVYDKHSDKCFITSIKNIMAETRFNDFVFEDFIVSFEPVACNIETLFLPAYRRILKSRCLDGTVQEKVDLAYFAAFQMLRSKSTRQMHEDIETMLKAKIEDMGGRMEDMQGWYPQTEDSLKMQTLIGIQEALPGYASIIACKDYVLIEPAPGRSFYLGDNPVVLHNNQNFGPYGNLGLAVEGIEIYLPLSSDLLLGMWCPSVLKGITENSLNELKKAKSEISLKYLSGRISLEQMNELLLPLDNATKMTEQFTSECKSGAPIASSNKNMDYYNSIQSSNSYRYVVCRKSDFDLARQHNLEFPDLRKGRRFTPF